MTRLRMALAALGMAMGLTLVPAGVATAAPGTTCDAYSQHCPQRHHRHDPCDAYSENCVHGGQHYRKPPVVLGQPFGRKSLPFTGAEVTAMAVVAVGLLGGGVMLVAAGRRRRAASRT